MDLGMCSAKKYCVADSRFKGTLLIPFCLLAVLCGCGGGSSTTFPPIFATTFATSVKGKYTKPDSVTFNSTNVFVGFGNGNLPDGSDGKSNTIVEYTMQGDVVQTFTVKGHNDGLRIDPLTGLLWAMQNEDANASLVIIDPASGKQTVYTFGPNPCGGGYDDIVFDGAQVFLSCSNPAKNPNTDPAIVSVTLVGTNAVVAPVMLGNASAVNKITGQTVTLNLQDPDSMVLDPAGVLVLDSQADSELVFVTNPGTPGQTVKVLPITTNGNATQLDDTVFTTSPVGTIFVASRDADAVITLKSSSWPVNGAYSATGDTVSQLDLTNGSLTVVVLAPGTGTHGMAFVPG